MVLVLVALAFGAALGWLIAGRGAAGGKATAESLRMQLDGVAGERDGARAELNAIRASLDEARSGHAVTHSELAALKAAQEERERAFEARLAERDRVHGEQIALMQGAKEALSAQFSEIGTKLLGEAQARFLQRADERFNQSEEKSGERLKALLHPVSERLKAYEDQVGRIEKERTEAYGDIKATIEQVRVGAERVQSEAARLVSSLRNAPKARGRWGEQQLRNVLESCGLTEHVDFVTEHSVDTEDGRLRPDAIVRIPGGKQLIIDAKVSLNAYQDAFDAGDDDGRRIALTAHCVSMKTHINALGGKAYQSQFSNAPDYVIMFIPGEHFLAAALEHDNQLWDYAFNKKVLLATPTNLVAIARTVSSVWQQEAMQANAREIADLGREMYDRLAKAAEDLKRVGGGLGTAVRAYNDFAGSFEARVMVTGRKFESLKIETGKRDLAEIPPLEALPRYGDPTGANDENGAEAAE